MQRFRLMAIYVLFVLAAVGCVIARIAILRAAATL